MENIPTKTMEEIYHELFTDEMFTRNPLFIVEAIGYLTCLLQFLPAEKWIINERVCLLATLKELKKEGVL